MNKLLLPIGVAGITALLVATWLLSDREPTPADVTQPTIPVETRNSNAETLKPAQPATPASILDTTTAPKTTEFSQQLRAEFGATIHHAKVQIRALEKMIQALRERYGANWHGHIEDMIRLTFPELAELLLPRLQNLLSYNEWALAHREQIASMSEAERRQFTWAKRTELFGDDAEIIWQGQLRTERVQDVLIELNESTELPLDRKIDHYLEQFNTIYQEDAAQVLSNRRQEVMDQFLTIETVQSDLHALPEPERREHLRQLRSAVGMDEAALGRWDELDALRTERWRTGKQYLKERIQLEATLQGEALETGIQQLQERMFGEEAEMIRNEEASGYFRYQGAQQLGLN
jgi:hypothetical protein